MVISINRPDLSDDFISRLDRSYRKGSEIKVTSQDQEKIGLVVKASGRIIGKFVFKLEDENCTLIFKHVIEGEYYPLELAIEKLIRMLKRKKQKYIVYN